MRFLIGMLLVTLLATAAVAGEPSMAKEEAKAFLQLAQSARDLAENQLHRAVGRYLRRREDEVLQDGREPSYHPRAAGEGAADREAIDTGQAGTVTDATLRLLG